MTPTPSGMTPDQFNEMLNTLHLSQVQLARQIKATPRAVNYWASGRRKIPGSVEAYLRVLDRSPRSLRDLERDATTPSEARDPSRVLAYHNQVQFTARLLWENGEMQADTEGRQPTWNEVCAMPEMFFKRIEVEGYAKAVIAAGFYSGTPQQVIDRLTSEGAIYRAYQEYNATIRPGYDRADITALRKAITAAIAAASAHNEGGEG